MTVTLTVNNPGQTITLDMIQEKATQTLALVIADGVLNIARQPRSEIDMLLDEEGFVLDFLLDEYITKD